MPTTVTDTPNVTPNLGSGGKDKPESEESQIGHFMIPTSVAAAVGSLLLITAAITVAACVCYHWRKQKGGCTYNMCNHKSYGGHLHKANTETQSISFNIWCHHTLIFLNENTVHNKSPTTLQQPELPSEDKSGMYSPKCADFTTYTPTFPLL